jgi:hypothetical protein
MELHSETLLTRRAAAAALSERGYPTSAATLATRATRGGSPPYRLYNRRAIYRWGDLLAYAEERTSEPRSNTSEGDTT